MDPLIMDRVLASVRARHPEFDLRIDSISVRGLAPSIRFTVLLEEYRDAALEAIQTEYRRKGEELRSQRDRYWDAIVQALDAPAETQLIASGSDRRSDDADAGTNIGPCIDHAIALLGTIAEQPADSELFCPTDRAVAMETIGAAIKCITAGQVQEAARRLVRLADDLGPAAINTTAYAFFNGLLA